MIVAAQPAFCPDGNTGKCFKSVCLMICLFLFALYVHPSVFIANLKITFKMID